MLSTGEGLSRAILTEAMLEHKLGRAINVMLFVVHCIDRWSRGVDG